MKKPPKVLWIVFTDDGFYEDSVWDWSTFTKLKDAKKMANDLKDDVKCGSDIKFEGPVKFVAEE